MVASVIPRIVGRGFCMELHVLDVKELWADCVAMLRLTASDEEVNIKSVRFYISRSELSGMVNSITQLWNCVASGNFAFISESLAFQLSCFDADEAEVTVRILVNIGVVDDCNVYAGSLGQVVFFEMHRFASSLSELVIEVFPLNFGPPA